MKQRKQASCASIGGGPYDGPGVDFDEACGMGGFFLSWRVCVWIIGSAGSSGRRDALVLSFVMYPMYTSTGIWKQVRAL